MVIEPGTQILILKDVPLDESFSHSLYFNSESDQASYFTGLVKYSLTNQTYQRVNRGVIRVDIQSDKLYDCNYVMFKNASFGNKWFYAFIKSVEYVNNSCSEISYERDPVQSWFFDYECEMCFVEREHSVSDEIGEHIEPESLDVGEYVFNNYIDLLPVINPLAVLIMVYDDAEASTGDFYDRVYGGCSIYAYNSNDTDNINAFINSFSEKPEAIVGMYMCPSIAVTPGEIPAGGVKLSRNTEGATFNISATEITTNDTLDGYKPKNNKLYTYPYNFYSVSSASGGDLSLRYEFFEGLKPTLKVDTNTTMPIQCIARPINYKGCGDTRFINESIMLSTFPMCSWGTDAYRAWVAQNGIPDLASNALSTAGSVLIGGLMGGPHGLLFAGAATLSGANKVGGILSNGYKASFAAPISKGSLNCGSVNISSNTQSFYGGRCSVSAQYAKIIDDYFTVFGYATNLTKVPNRNSRPHWNYVKTIGCTLKGSVPADDMKKLCSIYDNGITFWKNGNEVGDYSLDNSP